MRRTVFTIAFLLMAANVQALRLGDTTVIVPIIGRFQGALETQWRTDLFIANPYGDPKPIVARFYVTGASMVERAIHLPEYTEVYLPDVVLSTFGLSSAGGLLVLTTTALSAIDARARIYNSGNPAGEFGQSVPGIGMEHLRRQAYLYGLSGTGGNRLNVGVANPTAAPITVSYSMRTATRDVLASGTMTVGPFQVVQVNDVFASWEVAPQANVSIQFSTMANEEPIYGYASEVRNDTGDAVFVFGVAPNV